MVVAGIISGDGTRIRLQLPMILISKKTFSNANKILNVKETGSPPALLNFRNRSRIKITNRLSQKEHFKSKRLFIFTFIIVLTFFAFGLSACSSSISTPEVSAPASNLETDPIFREFYKTLGGKETLGPVISEVLNMDNLQCQYTENALMCFNQLATSKDRYSLYPLGRSLGIQEIPANHNEQNGTIIDGFQVYEEFVPLFEKLNGVQYAGKPLSEVRYNAIDKRIEQYFENVGFFRAFNAEIGDVHLLAYGDYGCGENCVFTPEEISKVIVNPQNFDQPFMQNLLKIANPSAFGQPLTVPYPSADGTQEMQVYENVVLTADAGNPASVHLLNLSSFLDLPRSEPGPQLYDSSRGVVFYPVNGDLGFHVPVDFDTFIVTHGGRIFSGDPIGEIVQFTDSVYRQCFENYCLDFDPYAPESFKVRMAPLGISYLEKFKLDSTLITQFIFSPGTVNLQVNEVYPRISSDQQQQINLSLVKTENSQPIPDIETKIQLTLPDETHLVYTIPGTSADGTASISVPALTDVSNGSVIVYNVCLNVSSEVPICSEGSFLIWNSPDLN